MNLMYVSFSEEFVLCTLYAYKFYIFKQCKEDGWIMRVKCLYKADKILKN